MDEQLRVYPRGSLAAHVLGFVGHNPKADSELYEPATTGVEGLEYAWNPALRGVPGWEVGQWVNRAGETLFEVHEKLAARAGSDIVSTLDLSLQRIVEQELESGFRDCAPTGIYCVMVRPSTGEILAMANFPAFDPNDIGSSKAGWRRNRAITDSFEPGSTFKALTIGAALDSGVVSLAEQIDCENGFFDHGGLPLRDLYRYDHLTVEYVLAKSSNIGAAKIGLRMGVPALYEGVRRFGIGELTGIPLPAEARGKLRPPQQWRENTSITRVPMGHEIAATPLQMTMAIAAIANEGRLMRPLLVRQVQAPDGGVIANFEPHVRQQALSARAAQQMVQALCTVVEDGTGKAAALEGFRVAGKTGTADKFTNGRWDEKQFASFIGFFPAEDPELCIGVFVDEPGGNVHFGGSTAAPIFKRIAERSAAYLGLSPRPGSDEIRDWRRLAQQGGPGHLTGQEARSRM
jgi:cell division protein FtsI/penicillin-binding protein 2